MDELDKLKNHWKKNDETFPQVSEGEIFGMLHKRSSSTVKWILLISIFEFSFWGCCSLLSIFLDMGPYKIPLLLEVLDYINYGVLAVFIVMFYNNYRKISAEKPVKELLENIINIRRIVKVYIGYVISVITFTSVYTLYVEIYSNGKEEIIVLLVSSFIALLIISVFLVLYNALYGRLLRKLNKNYRELKKISGL